MNRYSLIKLSKFAIELPPSISNRGSMIMILVLWIVIMVTMLAKLWITFRPSTNQYHIHTRIIVATTMTMIIPILSFFHHQGQDWVKRWIHTKHWKRAIVALLLIDKVEEEGMKITNNHYFFKYRSQNQVMMQVLKMRLMAMMVLEMVVVCQDVHP